MDCFAEHPLGVFLFKSKIMNKIKDRTGEIYTFSDGRTMKIIEYLNSDSLKVLFNDGTILENVQYAKFIKGQVRNKNFPYVYGVGVIGIGHYNCVKNKDAYKVWNSMIERGYSQKTKYKQPAYKDCSVDTLWHYFQRFAKWYYDNYKEGFFLDKDILVKHNKVYSAKTCCFVPREINNSVSSRKNHRESQYPGVVKKNDVYWAQISINRKVIHLGCFKTETEAFVAYKQAKEKNIKELANKYRSQITTECYNALINWTVEKND